MTKMTTANTASSKKRGRPPLDRTPEEQKAARTAQRARAKEKTKNVTLGNEVHVALTETQSALTDVFGFQPTLSQTVLYLIKKADLPIKGKKDA